MMAVCFSNALHLLWQHVLYAPVGVEICAGLKDIRVRDNNIVQRFRTELLGLYKHTLLLLLYLHI